MEEKYVFIRRCEEFDNADDVDGNIIFYFFFFSLSELFNMVVVSIPASYLSKNKVGFFKKKLR
jgi:dimeric dUTPase (all-alpha-NTP-PPase superfamily)